MLIISFLLDILCTFIEAFYMYRIVDVLLPRRTLSFNKKNKANSRVIFMILIIICMLLTIILNQIALTSIYTSLILMIYNIIIVLIFWRSDWVSAIAAIGGYFFILFVEATIEMSVIGMIGGEELIYQVTMEQGIYRICDLIISKTIWVLLNTLVIRLIKRHPINKDSMKYIMMISLVGIVGFVFILYYMLTSFSITINVVGYVFLISGTICIFAIYYIVKSRNLIRKLQMMDIQNEMLERNYEQVSAYYEENARLYHDMKHHFEVLSHMLEKEKLQEAKEYLATLKTATSSYIVKHWTGLDIIDTIISDKVSIAEKQGIEVTIEAQMLPKKIVIERRDLCSIFANLLDNAIEALPTKIDVSINLVHRLLVIRVKNDYQNELKKENGKYKTTKGNVMHHGWGLQSVESVVNRYEGDMNIEIEDGIFCVKLMLNV